MTNSIKNNIGTATIQESGLGREAASHHRSYLDENHWHGFGHIFYKENTDGEICFNFQSEERNDGLKAYSDVSIELQSVWKGSEEVEIEDIEEDIFDAAYGAFLVAAKEDYRDKEINEIIEHMNEISEGDDRAAMSDFLEGTLDPAHYTESPDYGSQAFVSLSDGSVLEVSYGGGSWSAGEENCIEIG